MKASQACLKWLSIASIPFLQAYYKHLLSGLVYMKEDTNTTTVWRACTDHGLYTLSNTRLSLEHRR